ncbi:hypothetical protein [Limnobacter sp.]|uniref:hypothetical protein n=1 Tax=Limnobacter sp. TaxID=2003368 RepID=UPI002735BA8C|nr:hypothetical protein [Limnobacter sp.]MDP3271798.1 hypothetical protein [Limnobacter sp.]
MMIFVLADDNILHVLDFESESLGAFEGIDVEEGIYKFFDKAGAPLKAEFMSLNQTGKIFGMLSWVVSGNYRLVVAESADLPWLSEFLSSVSGLEKNRHFSSVDEVQKFLAFQSQGTC